ncbi:cystathionine beta-lyase [Aliidongia dinghuensis]|uniref:Cystathionine beta-lyase n=1 Tax=Aliidongia dinghuensis TaxID=1867774 RepID=A0A8J3E3X0_9PROT|nr:cystathionine beta-lyase [Aliidongia dinghuensis]GGF09776.1 cystathionine beta-lyase [Aliidongia dinghuensis]
MSADKNTKIETRLVHAGRAPHQNHGVVNPPIYHASTILQPTLDAWDAVRDPGYAGYSYGRFGTPTSRSLEGAVAELYGADEAVAVSSGLAAISVGLMTLTKAGDHILVTDSAYYPCRKICNGVLKKYGVETTYYDPTIGAGIAALIRPETSLIVTESPGSVTFEVQDIPAIVAAAHARGVKVMADNTWATALYFNPFDHGADLVVEAATKYIGGHSDVMMGLVLSRGPNARAARSTANALGHCSGADDLYLAQRGLRTLAVRLARCQETGLTLARWLKARPEVARVLHPALPGDPGHAIWQRDFRGASGLFSFVLHPVERPALARFLDGLMLFGMGASWGGYESLIMPNDPRAIRTATRWTDPGPLLRIHAGLEDPADLIADLEAGFERLAAAGR